MKASAHIFAAAAPLLSAFIASFAAAGAPAGAGQPLSGIHVATREFVVTVSPVDEESKNAENSDLYQRAGADDGWVNLGACRKVVLPDGEVRFLKTVSVPEDGLYQYTSRPVVGGAVSSPPDSSSPPQASVIVDTLAPQVAIIHPDETADAAAGDNVDIAWEAKDENLAADPVALSWSADGGSSWTVFAEDLPAEGKTTWIAPEGQGGPVAVKATAVDKAKNRGDAVRRIEVAARAVEPPAEETPDGSSDGDKPAVGEQPDSPPERPDRASLDRNKSWLYYLMAVNLMRQNKPKDALQYYWLAVKADPGFIDAWADISLAYIDVGAYRTAREIAEQTRGRDPERIDLIHLMGETYHAEAMDLLGRATSTDERMAAKAMIDKAVEWYGQALEKAADEWRLAEQAASFYRLGEVCYYVNMDREGARAYWMKILDLHSPAPNPDLVLWTPEGERDFARRRHQNQTYQRVTLETWQNWARGYITQLDEREREGMVDLMPAKRINRHTPPVPATESDYRAARPDGRSLFSLPTQYGSPDPVPAATAAAPRRDPAAAYSFYAPRIENSPKRAAPAGKTGSGKRSAFSGAPHIPEPEPADPYAFPLGGRKAPAWLGAGPYGDSPVAGW